jgi:predicted nucleic acid-binding protein
LLWPAANNWAASRRAALEEHMAFYLTLYPDEGACAIWAAVVNQCRRAEQPIQTADAWIAASGRQWGCPLVTTDFGDYEAIEDLDIVPIR